MGSPDTAKDDHRVLPFSTRARSLPTPAMAHCMKCRGKTGTRNAHIKHDRRGRTYRAGTCASCGHKKAIYGGSFSGRGVDAHGGFKPGRLGVAGGSFHGHGFFSDLVDSGKQHLRNAANTLKDKAIAHGKQFIKDQGHKAVKHLAGRVTEFGKRHGVEGITNSLVKQGNKYAHGKLNQHLGGKKRRGGCLSHGPVIPRSGMGVGARFARRRRVRRSMPRSAVNAARPGFAWNCHPPCPPI